MKNALIINGKEIKISDETAQEIEKQFAKKEEPEFEKGDKYWFISAHGPVDWHTLDNDGIDRGHFDCGNVYKTEEAAEQEIEKRKAIQTVKSYIKKEFGEFKPNFNGWGDHYYTIYWKSGEGFVAEEDWGIKRISHIGHLEHEGHADKIIAKFDKELRIIFNINNK